MAYTAVKTRVRDRSGLLFSYLHQGKNMQKHGPSGSCDMRIFFSGAGHRGMRIHARGGRKQADHHNAISGEVHIYGLSYKPPGEKEVIYGNRGKQLCYDNIRGYFYMRGYDKSIPTKGCRIHCALEQPPS